MLEVPAAVALEVAVGVTVRVRRVVMVTPQRLHVVSVLPMLQYLKRAAGALAEAVGGQ
jgi:hypothetical protein